ncbi:uncharacterized protein ACA1_377460 [Acanthamoeba castellanii str. Neff]|uniref:Uncharacterized protein n=1 Tax=Acanthamoeba castellanii (strain ATCC 30010 / Neff) TaxID=1257118 RepID=L8GRW2_ACACF|nr:uncharacterized protein ACA1_377460 [Acanthamoeba castellanii str. Neff]ELR15642.1 hypothetical protein ACA1_377460 [Acanthamoeba castellanii str. Neff]
MVPPADERQRRMFYGVLGMLMFVLVLMFLSQGRRSGRNHPEDLDLAFKYDEKEKTLTLHLFKSPIEEDSDDKKEFASRQQGDDAEWDEGAPQPSRLEKKSGRKGSLANGLFKRLSSKSHL